MGSENTNLMIIRGRRGLRSFFRVINSKDNSDELNYEFLGREFYKY